MLIHDATSWWYFMMLLHDTFQAAYLRTYNKNLEHDIEVSLCLLSACCCCPFSTKFVWYRHLQSLLPGVGHSIFLLCVAPTTCSISLPMFDLEAHSSNAFLDECNLWFALERLAFVLPCFGYSNKNAFCLFYLWLQVACAAWSTPFFY